MRIFRERDPSRAAHGFGGKRDRPATRVVPGDDPRLQWMGRTAPARRGGVTIGFPGVTLRFGVRGADRVATVFQTTSADCCFDVIVDDGPSEMLQLRKGRSVRTLAAGLATDVQHDIALVRRTESWQGVVTVREVHLPADAELLAPPPLPERRLLFIGDSITAGTGVDHLSPDYPKGCGSSNANAAYGMLLSRRLDAQVHLVACGGRGLVRDWQGLGNDATNNATIFFERSLPDDPRAPWDHARYSPDAIVIALGTNDVSVGIPEERTWVSAYLTFLRRIRALHSRARIFLATSPIYAVRQECREPQDPKAVAIERYLNIVASEHAAATGDARIELVRLRHQPGTPQDGHPTGPQHELIADDFEPALRRAWE
jgi:lysophospholipase L1-like esterase